MELAKISGRGQASGLVNAVLRKIAQNKTALPPIPERDEAKYLSIRYSHPKWLVKRLLAILGREEAEAFLAANNDTPPLTVQVNPLKTDAESLIKELEGWGVTATPHPWVPGCLELTGAGDLTTLASFREGKLLVQDPAARLVSLIAGVQPGQKVLDLCAAPGGQVLQRRLCHGGQRRDRLLRPPRKQAETNSGGRGRLDLTSITTSAGDGRVFRPEWAERFDTVLVDAPCSGLGIIRKKPDVRYKKADDLFTLPVIQTALLDNAAQYVAPGGVLVYSTCTILPEENEQVTDAFLTEHSDFCRDGFTLPAPVGETEGQLTLWPQRHGTDGFYICRMKRT